MSVTLRHTPFSIHAAAYWASRKAYETFRDTQNPKVNAYDDASGPLISTMDDLARMAIKVPAADVTEICAKIAIFDYEQLHDDGDRAAVRDLFDFILDDIKTLAPGAYPEGVVA